MTGIPSRWTAARQAQIEIRKVDDDERVGPLLPRGVHETTQRGGRLRQLADDLDETGDRQAAVVFEQLTSRRNEFRPTEAGNR